VEVVAAERVDVRVRDRSDARDRGLVGDDIGLGGVLKPPLGVGGDKH
jgi:hypothetical protein